MRSRWLGLVVIGGLVIGPGCGDDNSHGGSTPDAGADVVAGDVVAATMDAKRDATIVADVPGDGPLPTPDVPGVTEVAPALDVASIDGSPLDGRALDATTVDGSLGEAGGGPALDAGIDQVADEAGSPSPHSSQPPFYNCPGYLGMGRMAIDGAGTLYLGMICYAAGDTGPLRLVIGVSHDQGKTFDDLRVAPTAFQMYADGGIDGLLAAGAAGQVYAFVPGMGAAFLRSTDGGSTWQTQTLATETGGYESSQLLVMGSTIAVGASVFGVPFAWVSTDGGGSFAKLPVNTTGPWSFAADRKRNDLLVVASVDSSSDGGTPADGGAPAVYQVSRFSAGSQTLVDVGRYVRDGQVTAWGAYDGAIYALVGNGVWRGLPDGSGDGAFLPCGGKTWQFVVDAQGTVTMHMVGYANGNNTEYLTRWSEGAAACDSTPVFLAWSLRSGPHDLSFINASATSTVVSWISSISAATSGSVVVNTLGW